MIPIVQVIEWLCDNHVLSLVFMKEGGKVSWRKIILAVLVSGGVKFGLFHIINRVINHIALSSNELKETKESCYYDWRFGRIFFEKRGRGKPVLLIHDLNVSSSSYEWKNVINALSQTNTVYTLDLLGCGRSDKPNLTYTNFLYVQLLSDFIKNVISSKVDVIATGESGAFTLAAASFESALINHIMLINPRDFYSLAKVPTKWTKALRFVINTPIAGTLLYNIFINAGTIKRKFNTTYFYHAEQVTKEIVASYFMASQLDKTRSKYLYSSLLSRYTNANIIHNLKNITNSVFIIVGNGDPKSRIVASQYNNKLPSIEIVDLDNAKMLPQLEIPEEFLEQVRILFETS